MGFQDLSEIFNPGLALPIRGKTYTIPAPSAEDGLRLHMHFHDPSMSFTDERELAEIMKLLGAKWEPNEVQIDLTNPDTGMPLVDDNGSIITATVDQGTYKGGVYQEMADDGLSWDEIMHAGRTALIDAGLGRTMAEANWTIAKGDSGNPLPPTPGVQEPEFPNRAAKRAGAKAAKKAPTKTAGTGRTTAARKRTAKTTPAAARTTKKRG